MKGLIENWLKIGTRNPQDDERFYEIVAQSEGQKIDEDVFQKAIESAGAPLDWVKVYKRYEDLYEFMLFLNNSRQVNGQ